MEEIAGHFDADQFVAGLEQPAITIDGQKYVGRILSAVEFMPFEIRMRAAVAGDLTGRDLALLILNYCDVVFPLPWWKFWKASVGRRVLGLAPLAMMEAVKSFLVCQGKASGELRMIPSQPPQADMEPHGEPLPAT